MKRFCVEKGLFAQHEVSISGTLTREGGQIEDLLESKEN